MNVEHREDGIVVFAPNGDPVFKLGEDGCLLHSFDSHPLDSRAAKLSPEALEALRDWSIRELGQPNHLSDQEVRERLLKIADEWEGQGNDLGLDRRDDARLLRDLAYPKQVLRREAGNGDLDL